jgi:3',5'-cyclic AMP phosphodiesterase CpdA
MDVTRTSGRIRLLLIAGALLLGRADALLSDLPSTDLTMRAIGQRLARTCSERELNAVAARGEALLDRLRFGERFALARGNLRFTVDRRVIVDVAVPSESVPFWIADQGFQITDIVLENPDTLWRVYRKAFSKGTVGLGVNGLDRTPLAHYVVFLRTDGRRDADRRAPIVTLDDRASASWNSAIAGAGVSAAVDFHKPFKSVPEELVGSVMLQPSHDNRHSALLAKGRVWKTRVVSSEHPSQVVISFGSDPARELVWTWTTSTQVRSTRLRIRFDRYKNGWKRASRDAHLPEPTDFHIVMGESTAVEVHDLLNDPIISRHKVTVKGLKPDTVYSYSLGDGAAYGSGPWRDVKTAPDRPDGLRFVYLGDAQTGLEGWGRLLTAAHRRHPSIDFILLAGDLVDRGNERSNWDHFFLRAAGVFERVPLMPCVGNHEYLDVGPRLYQAFFELPRNGPSGFAPDLAYHFEAGDACFAVLDSTLTAYDSCAAQEQADWLDRVLSQTSANWKFVMLHHPIYPSHPWRDTPALRERLVPIFDKHHVDFVLQGHDHAYQRTYPLRGHARARTPAGGTIYLMAVSGDKFVEQTERPYVEVGRSGVSTYQTFEIEPSTNRLTYRAWTEDGTVVDGLSIVKEAAGGRNQSAMRWPRAWTTIPQ